MTGGFTIRAYHVDTELGGFTTDKTVYPDQISAEIAADTLWREDQYHEDSAVFDGVVVLDGNNEVVYEKE